MSDTSRVAHERDGSTVTAGQDDAVVVGVDFGTLSGRALVVRVHDGAELGVATTAYRHAVLETRLPDGMRLAPDWALQVPSDYIDVLREAVPEAVARAGVDPARVIGIATDFTACTVLPTDKHGKPLCEDPRFATRPHAYVKLWKHHAAQGQANRINSLARERAEPWLSRYGGLLSSEWELPKGLQILEEDPELYGEMTYLVEAADWIVWQLCGQYVRNACTAGYKGAFQDEHYPSNDYLAELHPEFATFATKKLAGPIGDLGGRAGSLTSAAAALTGLPEGIAVAVGNVDAHVTAPAVGATEPGQLVVIVGTSTCHVVSSELLREVPGMCGAVKGGIVPGLWGYEAGQSAVGDIFGWFVDNCVPARYEKAARARGLDVHEYLTELAAAQEVGAHGLLALDWHNGNRSVLADHELSALLLGQTLATTPEDIYRALMEATAFGARLIVETFVASGLPLNSMVFAGGLIKNQLLLQIYADVLNMSIGVSTSPQAPALGAAIQAAIAAGAYPDIRAAASAMGRVRLDAVTPRPAQVAAYDRLYREYVTLHDHFGRAEPGVMHRLRAQRRQARSVAPGTD
jgi:L-ribulokinase